MLNGESTGKMARVANGRKGSDLSGPLPTLQTAVRDGHLSFAVTRSDNEVAPNSDARGKDEGTTRLDLNATLPGSVSSTSQAP
jgi:hypothetical protein